MDTLSEETMNLDKKTVYNSGGLINCLHQPGQLCIQPTESMRVRLSQLIDFSVTTTNPAI
jgi:hypothetical protein